MAAWKQLRLLRAEGYAFRREQKIGSYWADFVCLRRRLIVEVDGGVHDLEGRREHDARRDAGLVADGFKVMRFSEAVILSSANWLQEVRAALHEQPEAPYRWKTSPKSSPPDESDVGPWWEERE
ncbi:MAG: endonuclease domain-containing protein [Vitreimonas sp.]